MSPSILPERYVLDFTDRLSCISAYHNYTVWVFIVELRCPTHPISDKQRHLRVVDCNGVHVILICFAIDSPKSFNNAANKVPF